MSSLQYIPKQNIVLIGFMGCGKTTVATRLAYALKLPCQDTDKLLEKSAGKSVSEIFAQDGEPAFRSMETQLLQSLLKRKDISVYSVGGGTPVREENRQLLGQLGKVVYLRVRPKTVYERLKGDTTRPLLQCDDPLAKIGQLMGERERAYEESADLIVDADEGTPDEVLAQIILKLRKLQA